jgi:uncharacterized iron-regulated protein
MKAFSLLAFLLFTSGLARAQQFSETRVKMYDTESGEVISLADIIARTADKKLIVFGEEHNDSLAHVVQHSLFTALLDKYPEVVLSMEMFERDVQLVLDEYLIGLISESSFTKESRPWSNYKDYAPLVNLAKTREQQVIAANVPGRYARMVSQNGLEYLDRLPREAKKWYSRFDLPEQNDPYLLKFNEAMGDHGHHMGPGIFHAQLLRDATMAESLLSTSRKNRKAKILHLTGRFHSDEALGTVAFVKEKKPRLAILTISCFPAEDFQQPDWDSHQGKADIVILTDPSGPKTY